MSLTVQAVVLLTHVNEGMPTPEHFRIEESEVNPSDLQDGGILISVRAISADPYLRGSIKSTGSSKPGQPMAGFVSGTVLESKSEAWSSGDFFGAALPFKTFQIIPAEQLKKSLIWKLPREIVNESNISLGVGLLGMPGSTAYGGLIDVLRPNKNETIFISAASGAVGSLVGQLAKQLYNCTVIGSCGGPEKCELAKGFGFDHVIDYKECKSADELAEKLRAVAPNGTIDMYFENVGGMHFDAAYSCLANNGRIAICGSISEYNDAQPKGQLIYPIKMIYSCQRIEGFVCMPWLSGQRGSFHSDMQKWYAEGKVVAQETFYDGIASWPEAFQALFTGSNKGKVVVRV